MKTNAYVLGLDTAFRGNDLMCAIASQGVIVERVSALNASSINRYWRKRLYTWATPRALLRRSMTNGEIACFLGHMRVLRRFVRTDADWALVFEDDASIQGSLKPLLATLSEWPASYCVVQLGAVNKSPLPSSSRISVDGLFDIEQVGRSNGTFAYAISRQTALFALGCYRKRKVDSTADWPVAWRDDVEFWLVEPPLASHPPVETNSLIGPREVHQPTFLRAVRAMVLLPSQFLGVRAAFFALLGAPFLETAREDRRHAVNVLSYRLRIRHKF